MEEKIQNFEWLKGDKILWIVTILISFSSLFFVYSASTNLEYTVNEGTAIQHLVKHLVFVVVGLIIVRSIGFIKFEYIGGLSKFLLPAMIPLLVLAVFQGNVIDGASASRWVKVGPISFQPSTLAYLILIVYMCRYLTKKVSREPSLPDYILIFFLPILLVIGLVGKENGSTGLMIFLVSVLVMILGHLPWRYIGGFIGAIFVGGILFYGAAKAGIIENNRIDTWESRVKIWFKGDDGSISDEVLKAKNYQVDKAKAAIVHGGFTGVGPGKSALKQVLPQSVSDFIFAVIIEEYGLLGAFVLIFLYFVMLVRMFIIARNIPSFFGSILVLSIMIMIFVQLAVNIAVALNIGPVTGQPLPLISYGGTAILTTYIQIGLVLNVSSRIPTRSEEGIGRKQKIEDINDIA